MFVPGKPLQLNLMFASKATAYPSKAPFRCHSRSAPGTVFAALQFILNLQMSPPIS